MVTVGEKGILGTETGPRWFTPSSHIWSAKLLRMKTANSIEHKWKRSTFVTSSLCKVPAQPYQAKAQCKPGPDSLNSRRRYDASAVCEVTRKQPAPELSVRRGRRAALHSTGIWRTVRRALHTVHGLRGGFM